MSLKQYRSTCSRVEPDSNPPTPPRMLLPVLHKSRWIALAIAATATGANASPSGSDAEPLPSRDSVSTPKTRPVTKPATPAKAAQPARATVPPTVTVNKSPLCGCCQFWVEYLEKNNFKVVVHDRDDMTPVKRRLEVPQNLASCHTATVDGYVIEGHVPAASITKLLKERPAVSGIAVPGMPIGSPGMEGPNPESYEVIAYKRNGERKVFTRH